MKKQFILIVMVAALFSINSMAQKSPKLGHINSQELLAAMPETDSAQLKIQSMAQEYEKQMELMQVEFNNKYQTYLNESETYTNLIRQTKESELQDLQERIQQFQLTAEQDIQNQRAELFQPIIEKAQKAVQDVAKENGYSYVFDTGTGAVVYTADDTEDLMPKVKVKLGLQ